MCCVTSDEESYMVEGYCQDPSLCLGGGFMGTYYIVGNN